ncbi:YfiR family protein [Ohtaekwangia sp.]|uniref:YfiR family protein n=1 Tax=Ohtaekwangia sp. TaxID=2066019 RepID=UPI002F9319BD
MRTLRYYILFAVVLASSSLKAQTTNYQVYSLFVINIAKYSSWPELKGEIHITVFGKSKIFDELMKQNGKNVNGQIVKVNQVDNLAEISQPHIIFLADGRSGALEDVLKVTQGKPVMVISEREGLFKKGAGFSFVVMENSTLRFDINNTELEKRQIKVSKNLSALANASI